MKVKSQDIRVFPTAYRGENSNKFVFDPSSRLFSENNLSKNVSALITYETSGKSKGSFVISDQNEVNSGKIRFILGGYYFELNNIQDWPKLDNYYAHIVVGTTTWDEENIKAIHGKLFNLMESANIITINTPSTNMEVLDSVQDDNYLFDALIINNSAEPDTSSGAISSEYNYTLYSLKLFNGDKQLDVLSRVKFTSEDILGDVGKSLKDALNTNTLITRNICVGNNEQDESAVKITDGNIVMPSNSDNKGIIKNSTEATKLDFKENTIKSNNINGSDIVASGTLTVGETNVKETLTSLQTQITTNKNELQGQITEKVNNLQEQIISNDDDISNLQNNKANLDEDGQLQESQFPIDIKVNNAITADTCTGNAGSATKLQTGRNISISGDVSAPAINFTGETDITLETTIQSIDNIKTLLLDFIYPVGSIYMNFINVNPQDKFGGAWQRLKDKFLLGVGDDYAENTTGGQPTVTLTTNQMPSHGHIVEIAYSQTGGQTGTDGWIIKDNSFEEIIDTDSFLYRNVTNVSSTGGGQAHENMPPYQTVYMWRRIGGYQLRINYSGKIVKYIITATSYFGNSQVESKEVNRILTFNSISRITLKSDNSNCNFKVGTSSGSNNLYSGGRDFSLELTQDTVIYVTQEDILTGGYTLNLNYTKEDPTSQGIYVIVMNGASTIEQNYWMKNSETKTWYNVTDVKIGGAEAEITLLKVGTSKGTSNLYNGDTNWSNFADIHLTTGTIYVTQSAKN